MTATKTYCVGRFLVDLPDDFEVFGGGYDFILKDIESKPTSMDKAQFAEMIQAREDNFKPKPSDPKYVTRVEQSLRIDDQSHLIVTAMNLPGGGDKAYGYEYFKLSNGMLFTSSGDAYPPDMMTDSVIPAIKNDILPHLRYRAPDEIPTEPGFCIDHGFIADSGEDDQVERVGFSFVSNKSPDTTIMLTMARNHAHLDQTLFEREDNMVIPAFLRHLVSSVRTLRKGEHDVGPIKGQEILQSHLMDEGFRTHLLVWDSIGAPHSIETPAINVTIETGENRQTGQKPIKPTLSDQKVIELFDHVVNSIRVRPTSPGKVSTADTPPILPIGELARTGTPCPQTGLWKCAEAGDVEGGRTQRFEVGAIMPQARIKRERDFWQKLKGGADYWDTDTAWQLVAHDEPAKPATESESSVADSTSTEPRDEQPS